MGYCNYADCSKFTFMQWAAVWHCIFRWIVGDVPEVCDWYTGKISHSRVFSDRAWMRFAEGVPIIGAVCKMQPHFEQQASERLVLVGHHSFVA